MSFDYLLKALFGIGLILVPCASSADAFSYIEPEPVSELWLNPGFYSYHFRKNKGLSNDNFGLGAEYRYSTANSVTLGMFDNSDRWISHYAGWYWQPLGLGPARLGAVVGAIDGYPKVRHGGWFLAAIPAASIEYKNIGANLLFVPSYRGRTHGSLSLQVKLRVY